MGDTPRRVFRLKRLPRFLLWSVLIFGIYQLFSLIVNREPDIVFSYYGFIENKHKVNVLWIREEKICYAPIGGTFLPDAAEGEKVARGAQVGSIKGKGYNKRHNQKVLDNINRKRAEIRRQIEAVNERHQQQKLALILEKTNLEKAIASEKNQTAKKQKRKALAAVEVKLNQEEREFNETCQRLEINQKEITSEEERYYQERKNFYAICRTGEPGLVSFQYDGLEDICDPAHFNAESYIWLKKGFRVKTVKPQQTVTEGTFVYKLIANDKLFGLASLPDRLVEDVTENQPIYFYYDSQVWWGRVVYKSSRVKNKPSFLIFSCDDFPNFALSSRRLEIQLVLHRYDGVILPLSSLAEENGVKGVYIEKEMEKVFIPVQIVGTVNKKVAVEGIPEARRVITDNR